MAALFFCAHEERGNICTLMAGPPLPAFARFSKPLRVLYPWLFQRVGFTATLSPSFGSFPSPRYPFRLGRGSSLPPLNQNADSRIGHSKGGLEEDRKY